ncbi:hypothetical protein HELRODRAFT_166008 [Helobdella robusta]|uniref:Uncharacterized protein n=1 Tax=Helobdella robusta TaxID=6412 RepID=T1EXL0_HELRO|nr:hypothetical protein HELRODRAFT_166008 [Helobdella robusta]ESN90350.1 hypothetical protein HELRODRAFT_166008 [Helobdella robusta]
MLPFSPFTPMLFLTIASVAVVDLVKSCDKIPPDGQLCQAINDGTLKALVLTGTGFTGKCGVAITDEQLEKLNEVSVSSGANDLTPGDKHVLMMVGPEEHNEPEADERKRLDRYVSLVWLKTDISGLDLKKGVNPGIYDMTPFMKPEEKNASYQVYLFKQGIDGIQIDFLIESYETVGDDEKSFSLSNFVNKNLLCKHLLGAYEFGINPNIFPKQDTPKPNTSEQDDTTKKPFSGDGDRPVPDNNPDLNASQYEGKNLEKNRGSEPSNADNNPVLTSSQNEEKNLEKSGSSEPNNADIIPVLTAQKNEEKNLEKDGSSEPSNADNISVLTAQKNEGKRIEKDGSSEPSGSAIGFSSLFVICSAALNVLMIFKIY